MAAYSVAVLLEDGDEYPLDENGATGSVFGATFDTLADALWVAACDRAWRTGAELVRVYEIDRDARIVGQYEDYRSALRAYEAA